MVDETAVKALLVIYYWASEYCETQPSVSHGAALSVEISKAFSVVLAELGKVHAETKTS